MPQLQTSPTDLLPCKVLVVEDNEAGRDSMQLLLSMYGCQVETAADGPEGVRMALAGQPHVAFVDIGLPGYDGIEVASRIRGTLGHGIFLVACTSQDRDMGGERAKQAQFDSWLVKPVELSDLLLWINKAAIAAN